MGGPEDPPPPAGLLAAAAAQPARVALFGRFFWGDCAAKVEALDVGSQGYLDLGRPSGRSERIGHSV